MRTRFHVRFRWFFLGHIRVLYQIGTVYRVYCIKVMLEQESTVYMHGRRQRPRGIHWRRIFVVVIIASLLLSSVSGGLLYARPLPTIQGRAIPEAETDPPASVSMPWPSYGQSAVGLAGGGILSTSSGSTGTQKPVPTASTAKTMTALAVLDKKPLKPGESGPMITITREDMQTYDWYFQRGGSLAKIELGEKISQYDALQALMLPSANNFADTLVRWAFGSMEAYREHANALARTYGMEHSNFDDASGFSPKTVSTADDLVRLGDRALRNPVLAGIVSKPTANIAVAGTINNTNGLLGRNGINGIKTGNTDEAGGVFLVSAERKLANGKTGTVIACVMGGPDIVTAMRATLPLLDTAAANIIDKKVVAKGQPFGSYQADWSDQKVQAVAKQDIVVSTWKDSQAKVTASLQPIQGTAQAGSQAGTATATIGSQSQDVPLVLDASIEQPDWLWRIRR